MSNLVRLAAVLAMSVAATACSGRVPSDGFKDLHYGMSLDELRSKGFNCQTDDFFCRPAPGADDKYTLFGKEASVGVETAGGKLVVISVHVDLSSDELTAARSKRDARLGRMASALHRSNPGRHSEADTASLQMFA